MVEKTMDYRNPRDWYYALTDYGNFLKTKEKFKNIQSKHYVKQSPFKGSKRELRGLIIKIITSIGHVTLQDLENISKFQSFMIQTVLKQLVDEGLLKQNKDMYVLNN
jgi:A/G-specific adenine glycosylase